VPSFNGGKASLHALKTPLQEFNESLLNLFKQVTQEEEFDAIKLVLHRRTKSVPGRMVKSKSRKPSTIVLSSRSAMACSVPKFSARSKITNACAVNTNA
jgi:hypothetical protein